MHTIREKLEIWMNDYKLKKKLLVLYLFCVLIPLVLTDSVILYSLVHSEQIENQHAMENEANAVQSSLSGVVERASTTAKNIYTNESIEQFLNEQYEAPLDYVVARNELMDHLMIIGSDYSQFTIYADNETIVNGGEFGKISSIEESEWYQYMQNSESSTNLLFLYDDWKSPSVEAKRKLLFLRKMDFFGEGGCEKVIKIEIDYSSLVRTIGQMSYDFPVYICQDGKILLSNDGHSNVGQDFDTFTRESEAGYIKEFELYGCEMQLYILEPQTSVFHVLYENMPMIIVLLLINIILPWLLMTQVNKSLTVRIEELGQAFESVDKDHLTPIPRVRGKDEIGTLMQNYNRMVKRTNELIQTVYKDRLREQEINIARQNAELLALHSQINPHFLFNALESIRMHSILKQEFETADMVEKLAIMERQNVDWGNDSVEIKKEMEFVEAYLGLQKYRFGDRLSYELDVEPECEKIRIPKLTVVTFVENACVHGIESKTAPGWIFVRIYKEKNELILEVEDTGDGIEEDVLADILDKMQNASIERLQEKGRVGMVNACLRLKMVTENTAQFQIESEKGVGTMIQIRIPIDKLTDIRYKKSGVEKNA